MKPLPKARSRSSTWQVRRCWQTLSLTLSEELNRANFWRRLDSDRIMGRAWISFVSDCVFGFTLNVWVLFGFNVFWNSEEDLRLSFVCLALFHLSGKPWAQWGVLTRDSARQLLAAIVLACPHQRRLPPPDSAAPASLACPHRLRFPLSASLAPVGLA